MQRSNKLRSNSLRSNVRRSNRLRLVAARLSLVVLAATWVTAGCSSLLGIDDANCDPSFSDDCVAESQGGAGEPDTIDNGSSSDVDTDADAAATQPDVAEPDSVDSGMPAEQQAPLCERYCETVMANCADGFEVYVSPETCLSVCETLPEGAEDDGEVNSVQCRLRQAELAVTLQEPDVHCPAAGPGGDGICGDNCDGFCSIMLESCDEFATRSACLSACEEVPDPGGYVATQKSGHLVQCLLWHSSAATQSVTPHCEHAVGGQGNPCEL